jgi:hypothetical protein
MFQTLQRWSDEFDFGWQRSNRLNENGNSSVKMQNKFSVQLESVQQ